MARSLRAACTATVLMIVACSDRDGVLSTAPKPPVASPAAVAAGTCELAVSDAEARETINTLIAEVNALEASGTLTAGQAGALRSQLANILRAIDAGNDCTAITQLEAFRTLVENYVKSGALSEGEAGTLEGGVKDVLPGPPFLSISAGIFHSCGVTTSGVAYCWGANLFGALGDGTKTDELKATPVSGGLTFAAISAGATHTCGITTSGAGYCWGRNFSGSLGDGTTVDRLEPVPVAGGHTFTSISVGAGSTCAIGTDAVTYCWGDNSFAHLGTDDGQSHSTPAPVVGGHTFASISVGLEHTCAITSAGKAFCWGSTGGGALGTGVTDQLFIRIPAEVLGGLTFTTISAGAGDTCGLAAQGAGFCWGSGFRGELGTGSSVDRSDGPKSVTGGHLFSAITVGLGIVSHSCAVAIGGAGFCWGPNNDGQLGDGTTVDKSAPSPVVGGLVFTNISAGDDHACGVTTSGTGVCWGFNGGGALGDGTRTNHITPTRVKFR